MSTRRGGVLVGVLRNVLTLVGGMLIYYFLPVTDGRAALQWVVFLLGLGLLIAMIARQVMTQLAAGSDPAVRVNSLLILLYPVVVLFALAYYVIQIRDPTQFAGLATRTDSLYYTVVTLGTVGYGDIHAIGQLARIVTMVQVTFDLVVIGALIAVASSRFQVVAPRRSAQTPPNPSTTE